MRMFVTTRPRWPALALLLACPHVGALSGAPESESSVLQRQRELITRLAEQGPRSTPAQRSKAAEYLEDVLAGVGLVPRRHEYREPNVNPLIDLLLQPYRGTNVYAVLEATRPSNRYVVVGAHYDSEPGSPGAGDNAAGVATVVGLAHRLGAVAERDLNFLFVLFDQEEDDEVGSGAFVGLLRELPYDVGSIHVTDLSGWDVEGDGAVVVQSDGGPLQKLYVEAAERVGIDLRLESGASSDNKPFVLAGYAAVGVFGDITRHLHKSTDTVETVDFKFFASLNELMFEVLSRLARSEAADAH